MSCINYRRSESSIIISKESRFFRLLSHPAPLRKRIHTMGPRNSVWTLSALLLILLVLIASEPGSCQPPPTQPLLIYNCAKMPSICRNVNQVNPLQPVPGVPLAGNIGQLDPGRNGGLDYITLTYDTSAGNKRNRRKAACPSNWKKNPQNACPRNDQPPTVMSLQSFSTGYQGRRWNPNNLVQGQAGYNVIANEAFTGPSGMIWTCDEWPPAM